MALKKLTADLNIIQKLDDEPNDVGGLTAQELKQKFDESGNTIQKYMNEQLVPQLEELGVENAVLLPENAAGFKYLRLNSDKVLEVSIDGLVWQATGSSGHLILDSSGAELPQRGRMQFMNGNVEDKNGVTVITGVKGDPGATGPRGETGATGPVGPKGATGPSVVPSIDPETGVMSFTVQDTASAPQSVSVRGPQGPQGVQGAQGAQGARGPQGIQGVAGPQGPMGETGPAGATGPAGKTGAQGPKGDPGAQGIQGPQGKTGPAGATGAQGPIGPQGPRGNDGADGRSFVIQDIYQTLAQLKADYPKGNEFAYQVIAENDEIFIYSERLSDWASLGKLQGPIGPQGIQGIPGPEGPVGPTGAQGIQGPTGPAGAAGAQGERGPQGEPGPTGPAGPAGPQGIQGAIGPEGPQGPAGVSGQAGKSAYTAATEAGYTGTEQAFNAALSQVQGHISSKEIHVTEQDKTAWNGKANAADLTRHLTNKQNPHAVTAEQVKAIPASEKGAAGGVATLGANGKVSPEQVDSFGKEDTLSASTAKLFGLPAKATPDDVLRLLCDSPEHVGDLKKSLRKNIGMPWLLCDGSQFRPDDYPELAPLCKKEVTQYKTMYHIQDIVKKTHPSHPYIFQVMYILEKGKWYVYSDSDNSDSHFWGYVRLTIVDAKTGAAEGHTVKFIPPFDNDYRFNFDGDIYYNNGQFAQMHVTNSDQAPLIVWSTNGYDFRVDTLGNGMSSGSDYKYWSFDYLVAYNGEFVGEAFYRYSGGYHCRVFHAPTIEEFLNVSTYRSTSTDSTNISAITPDNHSWYNRSVQYGQLLVDIYAGNSNYNNYMLIGPDFAPHYFWSVQYDPGDGNTETLNSYFDIRKIGKYYFMRSERYGKAGYCETYNGVYKNCPMISAFENTLDFDYDETNDLYYRFKKGIGRSDVELSYVISLTDTNAKIAVISHFSGGSEMGNYWIAETPQGRMLFCHGDVFINPTGEFMSPTLPTITDVTHYTYVKAKER